GASFTSVTVIVTGVAGLMPLPAESRAACTAKENESPAGVFRSASGVNFSPAVPSATVMKSPLLITVVPLLLKRVPPVIAVIRKLVTSVRSTALRVMTSPEADWVSSAVVAAVTVGASASGLTVVLIGVVPAAIGVVPPRVVVSIVTRV